MEKIENIKGEAWRQYKDTPYYFSTYGRVKRRWVKKETLLNPYTMYRNNNKDNPKALWVKIHGKPVHLARTIWEVFRGSIPEGYVVHHKDNTVTNNDLKNLELVTPQELGKKSGGRTSRRRLIYCYDNQKIYRGTRAAEKDLHVSRQVISDICNKKRKRPPIVRVAWFELEEE